MKSGNSIAWQKVNESVKYTLHQCIVKNVHRLSMPVLMKGAGYIGRRMLTMELPGKRKRGRPKRKFMNAVREDTTAEEVTKEDAEERTERRRRIRCGDP